MNDEIKEILENLDKIAKAEYYPEDLLTYKECQLLLDYITNLQYKYENQLHRYKNLKDYATNLQKDNERLKNQFNKVVENLQQPYLLDCEQQCKDCLEILGIKYDG